MMAGWTKVSKANPCRHCGKSTWCLQGISWDWCGRTMSPKQSKSGGWLHPVAGQFERPLPKRIEVPQPIVDMNAIYRRWEKADRRLDELAHLLGVDEMALHAMGVVWAQSEGAWMAPMFDHNRTMIGGRLRNARGEKWSVRGGHNGLFVSSYALPPNRRVYVTEGDSDTAALLSIGCYTIGRPSCSGAVDMIKRLLPRIGAREVIVVADHDESKTAPDGRNWNPGIDGALALAQHLPMRHCVYLPQGKDIRDDIRSGLTAAMLESEIRSCYWRCP